MAKWPGGGPPHAAMGGRGGGGGCNGPVWPVGGGPEGGVPSGALPPPVLFQNGLPAGRGAPADARGHKARFVVRASTQKRGPLTIIARSLHCEAASR
jgi:hypothetical protein